MYMYSLSLSLSLSLQIENIVHSRQNEVSFNTSWLENLYEEIILETQGNAHVIYMYINIMFKRSINYMYMYSINSLGDRVTPLVSNPGRIMLTSSRIYFQPFNNVEVVSEYSIHWVLLSSQYYRTRW